MNFIIENFKNCKKDIGDSNKVLILDRDNTINFDSGYTYKLGDLKLIESAVHLLRIASQKNVCCLIVTNQSIIARKIATLEEVLKFNRKMVELLEAKGCQIEAVYICPHSPNDFCNCRKPRPAMFKHILESHPGMNYGIVGDKKSDLEAGREIGATEFLVLGHQGYSEVEDWINQN